MLAYFNKEITIKFFVMVDELMPGRDMAIFSLCRHVIRYGEKKTRHEAEILDEIQTKVLKVPKCEIFDPFFYTN